MGYTHLALICGRNVRGGRPLYRKRKLLSVQESIQRERSKAMAEAARKRKGKKK
jgi:hypothetical protein